MPKPSMTIRCWTRVEVRNFAASLRQAGYAVDYRGNGAYSCYNGDELVFMAMGGSNGRRSICRINEAYIEPQNAIPAAI